ncbi:DUF484 family protein [Catenovulum sp. 2E275]|uniref:DUF484 family protein n=1 Tax=Catenovulum sp. 2E275 TaxID=2980497 RepID=UPI0021D394B2|nr:DUF484 family protein [Catenovulum sp. 2E275]MCU4675100.1 DUF484 family protein [Catenovulum sp. 2E275]
MSEQQIPLINLNEADIVAYLTENPDFFKNHPDLLSQMVLPHSSQGTVSLVERQLQVLREKVSLQEKDISRLISTAKQNEHIYKAFINLYMALLECPNSKQMIYLLRAILLEQIQLDGMKLVLFIASSDEHAANLVEPRNIYQDILQQRLARDDYYFGRLKKQEMDLFFTDEQAIKSVALIRLGGQKDMGILAFGSIDELHFQGDMDTLFLAPMVKLINRLLLDFSIEEPKPEPV